MYCLTSDKGEVIWQHLVRAPIWATSPVVDGRVVFGDKAGWMYMLSADDGRRLWELKLVRTLTQHQLFWAAAFISAHSMESSSV
jgi:FOG: WD40-like repeat